MSPVSSSSSASAANAEKPVVLTKHERKLKTESKKRKKIKRILRKVKIAQKFSGQVLINPRVARAVFDGARNELLPADTSLHLQDRARASIAFVMHQLIGKACLNIAKLLDINDRIKVTPRIVQGAFDFMQPDNNPSARTMSAEDFNELLMKRARLVDPTVSKPVSS